ncbi:MAG: type VI secretion system-associated FHA domain protein TagH, partial [Betaproteobacteria bacterium]|nr:type VI secretion system-associated FHA domain protein TagH [Betaproteobacteria bacterium]
MLTLTVTAVNGAPASTPMTATFGPQGGVIGRNPGVTLVLPDPERTISRQQAIVRYEGGKYLLEDQGANATLVNGAALAPGARCALKHGDLLKIGPYTLVAAITTAAGADATNIFRPLAPAAPPPAAAPAREDPFADPMAGFPASGAVDPFAGLAPMSAHAAPPPPAPSSASASGGDPFAGLFTSAPAASPAAAAPGGAIPDDFDPFGLSTPRPAPAAADFSLGVPPDQSQSIDQLFGLGGASANPLDVLGAAPRTGAAASPAAQSGLDPLALFGGPAAPVGAGPALANHTPEIHAAFAPPAAQAARAPLSASDRQAMEDVLASVSPARPITSRTPVAATAPAPASAPRPAGPAAQQALMNALAQGLRTRLDLPDGLTEEFMLRLGALVHEAVQGTIDLLAARAVSKREVKAEATMIMERNNNPMKFSSDAAGALLFLLSMR